MSDPGVVVRVDGINGLEAALLNISPTAREAGAIAINRTVEEALADQRKKITERFTVRVPRFILPPVVLPAAWRATPNRLFAPAALGDSQMVNQSDIGSRRRRIMEPHGAAQIRRSADPENYPIAIPTRALRPTKTAIIPRKMYPRNLVGRFAGGRHALSQSVGHAGEFLGLGRESRERVTFRRKGENIEVSKRSLGRWFVLGQPGQRHWGLYERVASGRIGSSVRLLWHFRTESPIRKRLDWVREVTSVINRRFEPNYDGAISVAAAKRLRAATRSR